jgi:type II secretory pathway pseudopilin PulG
MKTRKNPFSMVEMLVVCTIIGVLFSMIIGSFDKARDMAGRVTCLNNIKNISVMTELYRKNNKVMPYTATWLTDFTFAAPYNSDTYSVFNCNGDKDQIDCKGAADLNGKTSYYFVPARATMIKNWQDAIDNGMSVANIAQISDMTTAAIYDKSPNHHKGYVNIVYLMSEESDKAGVGTTIGDASDLYVLDSNNLLNLTDAVAAADTTTNTSVDAGSGTTTTTTTNTVVSTNNATGTTTTLTTVWTTTTPLGTLGINPSNSDNNIFTITTPDGSITFIRDENINDYMSGSAQQVTIKVKGNGNVLTLGIDPVTGLPVTMTLANNETYSIQGQNGTFNYTMTAGNGNGQWNINITNGASNGLVVNTVASVSAAVGTTVGGSATNGCNPTTIKPTTTTTTTTTKPGKPKK